MIRLNISIFTTWLVLGFTSVNAQNTETNIEANHTYPDATLQTKHYSKQRQQYRRALQHLHAGHTKSYQTLKKQLADYPLRVYLDYTELKRQLRSLPYQKVDSFLVEHEGDYIADKLRQQWLNTLAKREKWPQYLQYYRPGVANTTRQCHYLSALISAGQKDKAFSETPPLWLVGESRPDACNKPFKHWLAAEKNAAKFIWQRMALALKKGKTSLANYLARQLPQADTTLAKLFIEVHRRPARLKENHRFKECSSIGCSSKILEIISHGLQRLGRRDPQLAKTLWAQYRYRDFSTQQKESIIKSITFGLTGDSPEQALSWILSNDPNGSSDLLLSVRIRLAMRLDDWQQVYQWLFLLSPEEQQSNRWQYWRARAQNFIAYQPLQKSQQSKVIYQRLAKTRDYYGFQAADILGSQYELQENPPQISAEELISTSKHPAIQRALELQAVNEAGNARKEWLYATRHWNNQQLVVAARVALAHKWYQQGILSMAKAKAWHDLQTRFPMAYIEMFQDTAQQTNINANWLLAIARQESSFASDAKSSAGALGLLQILPSTGKKTARQLGMRINRYDLLEPNKSIRIGGHYLAKLYKQFNNNRILASAAYNAGPYRVRKWLKTLHQPVTSDIWIETIPYKETRRYVQKVMTYSVIYGYRQGQRGPLMEAREQQIFGTANQLL